MPPLRSFLGGRTQQAQWLERAEKFQRLGDLHLLEFMEREGIGEVLTMPQRQRCRWPSESRKT